MIAKMYGVTVSNLLAANPDLKGATLLYPGEIIIIPPAHRKIRFY